MEKSSVNMLVFHYFIFAMMQTVFLLFIIELWQENILAA